VSGSASSGGVSNSSPESRYPSAAPFRNSMCAGWVEGDTPSREIVLRCGR
jgi:hypothetical protein